MPTYTLRHTACEHPANTLDFGGRVVPVSLRDNCAVMRLPSCLMALSHRQEGSHDDGVHGAGRSSTPRFGPAVYPVAAEPDHAARPHPPTAVGASRRTLPGVAHSARRQTAGP